MVALVAWSEVSISLLFLSRLLGKNNAARFHASYEREAVELKDAHRASGWRWCLVPVLSLFYTVGDAVTPIDDDDMSAAVPRRGRCGEVW
jgi:hypothetical protein